MMTDFRALCAELLDWAEVTAAHYIQLPAVMLRARAALADEPPEPAPPADGEVAELVEWLREESESAAHDDAPIAAARLTRTADLLKRLASPPVAIPGEQYHEDMGSAPRTTLTGLGITRTSLQRLRCRSTPAPCRCRRWAVTDPTPLSPAAQAVLDAAHEAWINKDDSRSIAAAALRAAADQVVPGDGSRRANEIRFEFLAIATELENHQ